MGIVTQTKTTKAQSHKGFYLDMKINQRYEEISLCLCVFVVHFLCYRQEQPKSLFSEEFPRRGKAETLGPQRRSILAVRAEEEMQLIFLEGGNGSHSVGNAYMPLVHPMERCAGP